MKPGKILLIGLGVIIVIGVVLFASNNRQSASPNPSPLPTTTATASGSLTTAEQDQIIATSTAMVKANTAPGYTYTLAIKKQVGDYVRVDVTPGEGEMIDPAQVIVIKENGEWKAVTFGTSFPEYYEKVPTLFE